MTSTGLNILLNAARLLGVLRNGAKKDPLQTHSQRIKTSNPRFRKFKYPSHDKDHVYQAGYIHFDGELSCQGCGCDPAKRILRGSEEDEEEVGQQWFIIHRGIIVSGELVMERGQQQDELVKEHKILCFEMEAAGALNDFLWLAIRGISNYARMVWLCCRNSNGLRSRTTLPHANRRYSSM